MPSPFPGMDPFIEGQKWADFHHECIAVIRESLVRCVRPRYEVSMEERIYVEYGPHERAALIRPDVTVSEQQVRRIFPPPFSRIPLKIKALVYFLRYGVVM